MPDTAMQGTAQGTGQETTEKSDIRIMDIEVGDIKLEWSQNNDFEVQQAKDAFDKAKKKGYWFYKVKKDGSDGALIQEFDPTAERIVGRPRVQGG